MRRELILNTNKLKDGSTLDFYNREHWPDLHIDDYTEEDLQHNLKIKKEVIKKRGEEDPNINILRE